MSRKRGLLSLTFVFVSSMLAIFLFMHLLFVNGYSRFQTFVGLLVLLALHIFVEDYGGVSMPLSFVLSIFRKWVSFLEGSFQHVAECVSAALH